MSLPRIRARVAAATSVGVAQLAGFELRFHKSGSDDSGKCDVYPADRPDAAVFGVLFHITASERATLDRHEGPGYVASEVVVTLPDRREIIAFAYRATAIDARLKPYRWYLEHVRRGAIEHRLPDHYLAQIGLIEAIDDPDHDRHRREMAIYRDGD